MWDLPFWDWADVWAGDFTSMTGVKESLLSSPAPHRQNLRGIVSSIAAAMHPHLHTKDNTGRLPRPYLPKKSNPNTTYSRL